MLQKRAFILVTSAALLLSSCGYRPEPGASDDAVDRTAITLDRPAASEITLLPGLDSQMQTATITPEYSPPVILETLSTFLQAKNFTNGGIYLEDEGRLIIINIVDLTPEIESAFQSVFGESGYRLQKVRFSMEQLEEATQALRDSEIYNQVNLYSWGIDVENNRIRITMPDSSESKKTLIETVVDPDMIAYELVPLGDPIIGTIVKIEENRFLFHVNGEETPSYWFSMN